MTNIDDPTDPETKSKTGIKVIIVSAGFSSLTVADECHLQRHDVVIPEVFPARTHLEIDLLRIQCRTYFQ